MERSAEGGLPAAGHVCVGTGWQGGEMQRWGEIPEQQHGKSRSIYSRVSGHLGEGQTKIHGELAFGGPGVGNLVETLLCGRSDGSQTGAPACQGCGGECEEARLLDHCRHIPRWQMPESSSVLDTRGEAGGRQGRVVRMMIEGDDDVIVTEHGVC